ncbi:sugar transporter [Legionella longbeachae]|uniref:sugar transporter n=1 Tax=Legionella longbeachae TaxID=450 RepID=UPI001248E4EB|nr:sugar transporter [Legionella longbeachae]QEY52866.1 sugar transporter [Legionella longbeachae]
MLSKESRKALTAKARNLALNTVQLSRAKKIWPWIERRVHHVRKVNPILLWTVVVPTIIAIGYYIFWASDVYISEAKFTVHSSKQRATPTDLGSFLMNSVTSSSGEDSFAVRDFILSRDALRILNNRYSLDKLFKSRQIDFFSRFDSLGLDHSFEALYDYYLKHVEIDVDSVSGISLLKTRAFTPQDTYKINKMLLEMSEEFINQLNFRSREDLIRFARNELMDAENKAKMAKLSLSSFQQRNGVFDIQSQSQMQLEGISRLQQELVQNENQLYHVKSLTPNNPQIASLGKRSETLRNAITQEMAKIASEDSNSFTSQAKEYQRLILDRDFADKQLISALATFDHAKNEALRKQLYLERIAQPNIPDTPLEPHRFKIILAVFILGLMAWGILTLLIANLREHLD